MQTGIQPNYWTYSAALPPAPLANSLNLPTPIVDSWCPNAPGGLPSYNFSFPPLPWNATVPAPLWTSSPPAYPMSFNISPIDYTVPWSQIPNTVMTDISGQPSFPSTGFYTADPAWTKQMLEQSTQEAGELQKQAEDSRAAAQTAWNKNWAVYSDGLGKQLELDGKPLKG